MGLERVMDTAPFLEEPEDGSDRNSTEFNKGCGYSSCLAPFQAGNDRLVGKTSTKSS